MRTTFLLAAFFAVLSFSGCNKPSEPASGKPSEPTSEKSSELTSAKAQSAISQVPAGGGTLNVFGVRSGSSDGTTIVDLKIVNFAYNNGTSLQKYTGPGTAEFQGYTDGRWVLTEIRLFDPGASMDALTFKFNIVVN